MNVNSYLKDILGTTTKIALWVKIIAILLFVFCTWINYDAIRASYNELIESL